VAWRPDGKTLASATDDKTIPDVGCGQQEALSTLTGHQHHQDPRAPGGELV
jgi:hypothetical protein